MNSYILRRCIGLVVLCGILTACLRTTPHTTKIGLIAPFEGASRDTGYSALAGVRLALREQNERAGSFRVQLVALDDHHDRTGQLAAQRAAELVADPSVVAVVGGFGNGPANGTAPVLTAAGVPFVVAAATDRALSRTGVLRLPPDDDAVTEMMLHWARRWGDRRWYVAGKGSLAVAMRHTVEETGQTLAGQPGQAGLVFYAGADPSEAATLLGVLRRAGSEAVFAGGPALDTPRFFDLAGPAANGAYYIALTGPADETFSSAYHTATGASPSSPAVLGYQAMRVLLSAMNRSSSPTRKRLAQTLSALHTAQEQTHPVLYRLEEAGYPGLPVAAEGKNYE